ncbi:molybdate ABC transporter substrate-binding protein [Microbulbifer halophilus]|uniref:Molybdate ABC transporter substrate-binding protein n=1 Tax=Microbulbifer halophilus TaxID=453963 RepID=A0ABW5ECF3_9GAMM|nr:molybdate ABC transporter substrate-binding protein [Microbulbifer halophilus]MCW8125984.1 molybdate ABC transporter substrate-binding protein [Microbulbifer halophilus]
MRGIRLNLLLVLMGASLQVQAEQLTVAVASNFTAPMREIAGAFEGETDHRVRLVFGSSGKFYAQIRHGAPFEAFFSADRAKPEALEQAGLAVPGSRFTYAAGGLALWSGDGNLVRGGPGALERGDFNKLALANPRLAPYGAAAVQVLRKLGLEEGTRPHWVQGENIAQAYQFVASGNADLGFVALSQVSEGGHIDSGSAWEVPEDLHDPIRQDAVLLKRGVDSAAARALLRFVRSERAAAIIESYGYR